MCEATDSNLFAADKVAIETLATIHRPSCGVVEVRNMVESLFRIVLGINLTS